MSSVCRFSDAASFSEPRNQVGELALTAGHRVGDLLGNVLQRTEIALVDDHTQRGKHFLGGRETAALALRELGPVTQLANRWLVHRSR